MRNHLACLVWEFIIMQEGRRDRNGSKSVAGPRLGYSRLMMFDHHFLYARNWKILPTGANFETTYLTDPD